MPKLDPYTLPRKNREAETRTFRLDGEEWPLTLTLRPVGFTDAAAAEEEAGRLIRTFLTGSEERGPAPFPDPDVTPSETLFRIVTLLHAMQAPKDPEDVYDPVQLAILSTRLPRNWAAVMAWFGTLAGGITETLGDFQPSPAV